MVKPFTILTIEYTITTKATNITYRQSRIDRLTLLLLLRATPDKPLTVTFIAQ